MKWLLLGTVMAVAACGQANSRANTAAPESAPAVAFADTNSPEALPTAEPTVAPEPTPASDAAADQATMDPTLRTTVTALRKELVGVGTVDGQPILDVQQRSTCETAFVTAAGKTAIDWRKVGNFAGRLDGGKEIIPLGSHSVSLPAGESARGVDGAFGLLADSCQQ